MYCYILYSKNIDSFYIGITTGNIDERIRKHNEASYGNHFTSQSNDWELFHSIKCQSVSQLMWLEKQIKKMKSRIYIQNLKKYPEIEIKLLQKYNSI